MKERLSIFLTDKLPRLTKNDFDEFAPINSLLKKNYLKVR